MMKTAILKMNLRRAVRTIREAFDRKRFNEHRQGWEHGEYHSRYDYETGTMNPDRGWKGIRSLCDYIYMIALEVRCNLMEHDWVDTSYGGPDSGDMSGYCKRCGYSFHHQLY
jgi:hypothetical protein